MRVLSRIKVLLPAPLVVLAACEAAAPTAPVDVSQSVAYSQMFKSNLHLVERTSWADGASVSAVITPSGGAVQVEQHQLVVPKFAVPHPTVFTMTLLYGRNLIVDLHAFDKTTGQEVDTFLVPLQLELSYAGLPIAREDLHDLTVVWLQDDSPDGQLVPVKTTINPSTQYLTGWLTHFSAYAMGMN